ncbi:hypothetical protein JHK86_002816 [Glycine max]|nr:hypothetical protein JHK86_002816 [Glycine max]
MRVSTGLEAESFNDESGLKFLPRIIPNSCHWVDCGGGSCNKTSMFSYNCECDAGYYNL